MVTKDLLKKALINSANNRIVSYCMDPLRRRYVSIFMLHRMKDNSKRISGHCPELLKECLEYLKRHDYHVVSVSEIANALNDIGDLPPKAVAFTMDDGFEDQLEIAVPIFESFKCPVSIFLLGEFSSEQSWPWDYQVEYIVNQTQLSQFRLKSDLLNFIGDVSCPKQKRKLISKFRAVMKSQPLDIAVAETQNLAEQLSVNDISTIPDDYRPITWDRARESESEYVQYGPHSMRHAILSSQSSDFSKSEISESWEKVRNELSHPLNVFCYPTGRRGIDFGEREMKTVMEMGFDAALSTTFGHVNLSNDKIPSERYCLKRVGFPDSIEDFIQYCSWIEIVKNKVRR